MTWKPAKTRAGVGWPERLSVSVLAFVSQPGYAWELGVVASRKLALLPVVDSWLGTEPGPNSGCETRSRSIRPPNPKGYSGKDCDSPAFLVFWLFLSLCPVTFSLGHVELPSLPPSPTCPCCLTCLLCSFFQGQSCGTTLERVTCFPFYFLYQGHSRPYPFLVSLPGKWYL